MECLSEPYVLVFLTNPAPYFSTACILYIKMINSSSLFNLGFWLLFKPTVYQVSVMTPLPVPLHAIFQKLLVDYFRQKHFDGDQFFQQILKEEYQSDYTEGILKYQSLTF